MVRAVWRTELTAVDAEYLLRSGMPLAEVRELSESDIEADAEVLCSFVDAEGRFVLVVDWMGGSCLHAVPGRVELRA